MIVHLVTEGWLEQFIGARLLAHCGHTQGLVYNLGGCHQIRVKAIHYRFKACTEAAVLVLTDFRDAQCACLLQAVEAYTMGKDIPPTYLLRFAVQELESWLLADRKNLARYLGISVNMLPQNPDEESHPKRKIINLARRSGRKKVLEAMVPDERHGGAEGPGYSSFMQNFILKYWGIEAAVTHSSSLERCVRRLRVL